MERYEDKDLARILRAIIREEVSAALEAHAGGHRADGDVESRPQKPPPGLDPYSLVPFAEYVLRQARGPLHVKVMAERIYALGFQHRWPPKHSDQLLRSLNSLASPSQHPDRFERVAPRTLRLR